MNDRQITSRLPGAFTRHGAGRALRRGGAEPQPAARGGVRRQMHGVQLGLDALAVVGRRRRRTCRTTSLRGRCHRLDAARRRAPSSSTPTQTGGATAASPASRGSRSGPTTTTTACATRTSRSRSRTADGRYVIHEIRPPDGDVHVAGEAPAAQVAHAPGRERLAMLVPERLDSGRHRIRAQRTFPVRVGTVQRQQHSEPKRTGFRQLVPGSADRGETAVPVDRPGPFRPDSPSRYGSSCHFRPRGGRQIVRSGLRPAGDLHGLRERGRRARIRLLTAQRSGAEVRGCAGACGPAPLPPRWTCLPARR